MWKTPRESEALHNTDKNHIGRAGSGDPLGFLEAESLLSEGVIPTVMPNSLFSKGRDWGTAVQSDDKEREAKVS